VTSVYSCIFFENNKIPLIMELILVSLISFFILLQEKLILSNLSLTFKVLLINIVLSIDLLGSVKFYQLLKNF